VTVSEDEIRSYYAKNDTSLGTSTYEQLHDFLRDIVLNDKKQAAVSAHVARLTRNERVVKHMDVINAYYESVYIKQSPAR